MNDVTLETLDKLLKLRDELSKISDLSYRYNLIKRNYPIESLDEKTARQLIGIYEGMLKEGQNDRL
jgi:hypothetical protein